MLRKGENNRVQSKPTSVSTGMDSSIRQFPGRFVGSMCETEAGACDAMGVIGCDLAGGELCQERHVARQPSCAAGRFGHNHQRPSMPLSARQAQTPAHLSHKRCNRSLHCSCSYLKTQACSWRGSVLTAGRIGGSILPATSRHAA